MMTRYCTQPIPEHGNVGVCGLRVDAAGRCPDAGAPTHQVKLTAQTHEHKTAPAYGELCARMVERPDGSAQLCGEPALSAIHDPAAYLAYAAELREELDKLAPRTRIEDMIIEYGTARGNLYRAKTGAQALAFIDASTASYTAIIQRIGRVRLLCHEQMSRPGHPDTRRVDAAEVLRILDGGE